MAKQTSAQRKAARRVAETTAAEASGQTETDKYKARLTTRLAKLNGPKMSFTEWAALFAFIIQALQACQGQNSARIARRTAKPGLLLHAIQIFRIHRHFDGDLTWKAAGAVAQCIIDEAASDPKAMVRFVDEARLSLAM